MAVPVYIESGAKRVFAGGLTWPGWCRSARDEATALEALVAYGPRYAAAVPGFKPPKDGSRLEVVERLGGDAGTDFGVPSIAPADDGRPVSAADLRTLLEILHASWDAFDAAARAAEGKALAKGPRGGGRDLGKIVAHVDEAERAYVSRLWATIKERDVRAAASDALRARSRGQDPPPNPRRTAAYWTPRYYVRRSAWHALDHAWEIEDRAG